MAFPTDWVVNRENASPITLVNIDNIAPIDGVGSLHTTIDDASAITERLTIQNNTYSNGLLAGRMRSVIEIDDLNTDDISMIGFLCMQNSLTAYNTNDAGYGLVLSTGVAPQVVSLIKYNNTITNSPFILDTSMDSAGVNFDEPFVFQLDWVSDFALLGGTLLRGYIGTNTTDFNDLIQVVEFTDVSSPILTSTTESLFQAVFNTSIATNFEARWDNTSIFQLT